MITFLRKLRERLIPGSAVTRYLLYAIGEILLVVVGILIALQINNWNQERQNRALEHTSLENLMEDLVIQREIAIEHLDYEAIMIARIDSSRWYLESKISNAELSDLLMKLTGRFTFVANKATFTNLGATGNIVLIENEELKNSIVRYYQLLDYVTSVVNNNNLFVIDSIFGKFVADNELGFRLNARGEIDESYRLDPEKLFSLSNQLTARQHQTDSIILKTNELLEATDELIGLVQVELDGF